MKTLDLELLVEALRYEPETGKLFWLPRASDVFGSPASRVRWNGHYAGAEALTYKTDRGYLRGNIFGTLYRAHRVAWAIHFAEWPASEIDHRDGDRANNKIANLREATRSENLANRRSRVGTSSKYLGVYHDIAQNRWTAAIGCMASGAGKARSGPRKKLPEHTTRRQSSTTGNLPA